MASQQFRLPDVGEGLTEAEIVTWHVRPGDTVKVNDPIVDIETAKSIVELPCPFAGVVEELLVPAGETVPVGTPIIAVAVAGAAPAAEPAPAVPEARPEPAPVEAAPVEAAPERTEVLVGYGPRGGTALRSRRRPPAPRPTPTAPAPAQPGGRPLATPPVRKLAKDRGVDLRSVRPTGRGGVVTRADVEAAADRPSRGRAGR